jgi:hypothetical protein
LLALGTWSFHKILNGELGGVIRNRFIERCPLSAKYSAVLVRPGCSNNNFGAVAGDATGYRVDAALLMTTAVNELYTILRDWSSDGCRTNIL